MRFSISLRQLNSLQLVAGEKEGKVFLRAKAVMADEEVVGQAKAMIDLGLTFAKQSSNDNAQAKNLLDALKVTVDGAKLMLSWSLSADDILEMAEEAAQRAGERRQSRGSRPPRPEL